MAVKVEDEEEEATGPDKEAKGAVGREWEASYVWGFFKKNFAPPKYLALGTTGPVAPHLPCYTNATDSMRLF